MGGDPDSLESKLEYSFRDRELLHRALTHKSRAFEKNARRGEPLNDNEQLEFLGDSVLGFLVSEALLSRYPLAPEGRLSRWKARLVSAAHLCQVAQSIDLGDYLFLGRGEEMSGGRQKRALLGNALEAVIAAVYLDGGLEDARRFVLRHVVGDLDALEEGSDAPPVDPKSALQELTQSLRLPMPRYTIVATSGPEHSKIFTVEARVGSQWTGRAEGASKKSAGQRAAQDVLRQILNSTGDESPPGFRVTRSLPRKSNN
jgi:ribonuclease-3